MSRLLCLLGLPCALFAAPLFAADIHLKVSGQKSDEGHYLVAVYRDAESFLDSKKAVREVKVTTAEGKAGFTLSDLAPGTYAIAVIQDKNDNGKLDTNFLGIPKEPLGASNNAPLRFGPPKFDLAKIDLKDTLDLDVALQEY